MILHCTYEELGALSTGAVRALSAHEQGAGVAAPPQAIADIELLLPRLEGDLTINVLAEQQSVARALSLMLAQMREHMDAVVLETHVAGEESIIAYFEYANVLTVYDRVRRMGGEMAAMIELITGAPPTPETAQNITFPE